MNYIPSLFSTYLIENKENVLEIQKTLKPGQILVSKLGEIWRWDGYVSKGKQNNSTKLY